MLEEKGQYIHRGGLIPGLEHLIPKHKLEEDPYVGVMVNVEDDEYYVQGRLGNGYIAYSSTGISCILKINKYRRFELGKYAAIFNIIFAESNLQKSKLVALYTDYGGYVMALAELNLIDDEYLSYILNNHVECGNICNSLLQAGFKKRGYLQYIIRHGDLEKFLSKKEEIMELKHLGFDKYAYIRLFMQCGCSLRYSIDNYYVFKTAQKLGFNKFSDLKLIVKQLEVYGDEEVLEKLRRVELVANKAESCCDKIINRLPYDSGKAIKVKEAAREYKSEVKSIAFRHLIGYDLSQKESAEYMETQTQFAKNEFKCAEIKFRRVLSKDRHSFCRKLLKVTTNVISHITIVGMVANAVNKYKTGNWLLFKHTKSDNLYRKEGPSFSYCHSRADGSPQTLS